MVTLLEVLYVVTGITILAAIVQLVRSRLTSAVRLGLIAAFGVILCIVLYWYLKPTA